MAAGTSATASDIPGLVALIHDAYRGDASRAGWTSEADLVDGERIDAAGVGAMLADPGTRLLVARDGSALVGCCRVSRGEGRAAELGTFAVAPDRQGSGVGAWLLASAERTAIGELGADALQITVLAPQVALLAWYERRGFARTGETRPFPADARFARPLVDDLRFVVLRKALAWPERPGT